MCPTLALPVFLCVFALTGALPSANLTRGRRAAAITGRFVVGPNEVNTLWPKTGRSVVIPYSMDPGFEEDEQELIRFSARYWSERTCVDWTEGLRVEHQVYITRGDGDKAHSALGKRPEDFALEQEIHLGEDFHDEENNELIVQQLTFSTVIHEMGHTMGLIHEHQRWDRDRWVIVNDTDQNYRLEPVDQTTTFGKPYDFGSVMHYPKNDNLTSRYDSLKRTMGSMYGPSFMDLWTVNYMYNCRDSCLGVSNVARCENGGFPNPKDCQQCICPEGFGGTCGHVAAGDNGAPPDCSKAVFASDSWQTLFGDVEAPAEHGHHRGPPACCYYHINVDGTEGGHVEVELSTVTAPTCNGNCRDGWVEFKTAGYEIGGPKACCQSDVQALGTMISPDTPFVMRACAHRDETRFILQYRRVCKDLSDQCPPFGSSQCRDAFNKKHCARSCGYCRDPLPQAGPACNKRKRRAVDLRSNCPAMLQKYGSCDGHPYAKIMKLVCRKTCKTQTVASGC